jgi:hypothetical protein
MVASLSASGAYLWDGATIKLSKMNDGNAQTRVYSVGGEIYRRINEFEYRRGDAPNPTVDQPGTSNASLTDWDGYVHWEPTSQDGKGTGLNLTAKADTTCTFGWTKPTYYDNFAATTVRQLCFVDLCVGSDFPEDCGDDDPSVSPDQEINGGTGGDGTSCSFTGLTQNSWYVGGVRMEWADENTAYRQTGDAYANLGNASLSNGATDTGAGWIAFKTDVTVTCDSFTPWFTTSTDGCNACNNSAGTTYHESDETPYQNNTCYYSNSGCTTSVINWRFIGNPSNGQVYPVSTGGGCQTSGTATVDCAIDCFICLHYDMMVTVLRSDHLINVCDVKVGDLIKTKTGYTEVLTVITDHIREGYYIIDGGLMITNDHPFIHNEMWITAEEYDGDKIYVEGVIPTVYIGTQDDHFLTYNNNNDWVVSGDYGKDYLK